ncbi:Protein of unknown function [Gryllus bimaculatus]|nr:Protein of unknown function [Gryllus bimaculatus]
MPALDARTQPPERKRRPPDASRRAARMRTTGAALVRECAGGERRPPSSRLTATRGNRNTVQLHGHEVRARAVARRRRDSGRAGPLHAQRRCAAASALSSARSNCPVVAAQQRDLTPRNNERAAVQSGGGDERGCVSSRNITTLGLTVSPPGRARRPLSAVFVGSWDMFVDFRNYGEDFMATHGD